MVSCSTEYCLWLSLRTLLDLRGEERSKLLFRVPGLSSQWICHSFAHPGGGVGLTSAAEFRPAGSSSSKGQGSVGDYQPWCRVYLQMLERLSQLTLHWPLRIHYHIFERTLIGWGSSVCLFESLIIFRLLFPWGSSLERHWLEILHETLHSREQWCLWYLRLSLRDWDG